MRNATGIMVVVCLAMAAPTFGSTYYDGGPSGTGTDWNTAENWDTNLVPAAGSGNAYINGAFSVTVDANAPVGFVYLQVQGGADLTINANLNPGDDFEVEGGSTATLNTGTLTCDEKFKIGMDNGVGTFYMKGGTMTTTDDFEIYGGSLFEFSGGSFTCDVELEHRGGTIKVVGYDAAGNLTFDGMKDTSSSSIFEFVPNAAGQVTPITNLGGSNGVGLVVDLDALTPEGDITLFNASAAQDAFASVSITKGGIAQVDGVGYTLSYTGGSGNDVVLTVVPEPATMSLLALGGLAMLRRRKR